MVEHEALKVAGLPIVQRDCDEQPAIAGSSTAVAAYQEVDIVDGSHAVVAAEISRPQLAWRDGSQTAVAADALAVGA